MDGGNDRFVRGRGDEAPGDVELGGEGNNDPQREPVRGVSLDAGNKPLLDVLFSHVESAESGAKFNQVMRSLSNFVESNMSDPSLRSDERLQVTGLKVLVAKCKEKVGAEEWEEQTCSEAVTRLTGVILKLHTTALEADGGEVVKMSDVSMSSATL